MGAHLTGVATRVIGAGGPILAGAGRALIHLVLAVAARVACLAAAVVGVARIHAEPPVSAQVGDVDVWRGGEGQGREPGSAGGGPPGGTGSPAAGYLAAGRPPHRTRWAHRSRGRSSRCGTHTGTGRWSASTCHRSCRGRSRTSARGSGGGRGCPDSHYPPNPAWAHPPVGTQHTPARVPQAWGAHPTDAEAEARGLPLPLLRSRLAGVGGRGSLFLWALG